MGFRDLALYNDSLLAKHAWRLLQDKISLFYNVFKAHFFPNCTIMEASESRNSSYIWKSILHGRDVLNRGACWRIGNGHSVKIWQHSWLPIKHPTRVPSHVVTGLEEATVELLIDVETCTWNTDLIDGLFVPHKAKAIKAIPLSRNTSEDTLCWPWTQSGKYSCKSSYGFLKNEYDRVVDSESLTDEGSFWEKIWALRIPHKTRNFIWRAYHNSISTKENLLRRHISNNALCDRRSCNVESTTYALWSCNELSSIWSSNEWSLRSNTNFISFKELLS